METLKYKQHKLFDNRLTVQIPDLFKEIEAETAEMLFPYEDRPQIIMGNHDCSRFCTFSYLREQTLSCNQIKHAISTITKIISNIYPSSILSDPEILPLMDSSCGWFSYRTLGDWGDIHNIMYIYSLEESMMLGTLGYLAGDAQGEIEMIEIMKSLKLVEKGLSFPVVRL